MVHVLHPVGLQIGRRLLAADAAGAIHGHARRMGPIQQGAALALEPVGELAKAAGVGLHGPGKGPDCALIIVARIDHDGVRIGDQGVPVLGGHIGAGLAHGIQPDLAHGHDLGLDLDLQPQERRRGGGRVFHVQFAEPRHGPDAVDHRLYGCVRPRDRPVDPLGCDQQDAAHLGPAQRLQPVAHGGAVRDGRKTVQGSDAERGGISSRGGHAARPLPYPPASGERASSSPASPADPNHRLPVPPDTSPGPAPRTAWPGWSKPCAVPPSGPRA